MTPEVEGLVVLTGLPEMVEDPRELTGHRHNCTLLGISVTACSQPLPEAAQIAIWSEGSQNVVGTMHQQAPQERILALGNALGRISITGLSACRGESQVGSDLTPIGKPRRILKSEDKCQGSKGANTSHLT